MTEKIEELNPNQRATTKTTQQTEEQNIKALLRIKAGFCQPASLQTTFVQHE
jgi:hypothetical protein